MKKEKTAGKAKTVGTLFTGDDLKKLIFPLIIEQILAVSVGMVDTMMVSSAGEAATSGVSLVDIINVLIINIFAAVATGGAVVTSQFLGQKRKDKACQSADQLILVTGVVALVIMALSILLRWQILNLISFLHNSDPVGNCQCLFLVMGYIDGSDPQTALQFLNNGSHLYPQLCIQI